MNSSKLPRVREGQRNPACCILLGGRVGHDLATEQQQHTIFSLVESSIPNHGYRGMAISEKGYKLNWTAQSTCTPNPHDEIVNAFSLPPNQEWDKDICPHHFYSSLYRKLAIPTRQEKKRQTEKVEVKLSFLTDDMIICRGRLMEFIKRPLE